MVFIWELCSYSWLLKDRGYMLNVINFIIIIFLALFNKYAIL